MTLVCPGGLSDAVTHLLKIWWTSCDGLGTFHVARAGANGVYNSSWEGLLPALFASWLKIYEMIWNDMIWYDMTWNDMTWYDMTWNDTSYTLQEIGDFLAFLQFGSSSRHRCSTAKAFGSHGGRCWDSALPEFGRLLSKQSAFFSVQNPGCSCFIIAFSWMIINYKDQEL